MSGDKRKRGRENEIVIAKMSRDEQLMMWQQRTKAPATEAFLNYHEPIPFSDCCVWLGSTQNGYPAVSQGHAKSKIKMHILAYGVQHGQTPQSSEVVSHLCHRKCCIEPSHLVIESITENNARKGCLRAFRASDGTVYNLCRHHPRCLRRDTDTVGDDFEPEVHVQM